MSVLFISDLHLSDQQPQTTQLFLEFCENKARSARALFILGDFFEYWLGDDALDNTAKTAQRALKNLTKEGVEIFFMAGNRDFLLGQHFAESCGLEIIEEPHLITLDGEQILLIHGDAECTDDFEYQKVRSMLRNKDWQQQFLQQTIEQRIEFAKQARLQSQEHTKQANAEIMDVNPIAIQSLYKKHQVKTIIHGHTHRPAIHDSVVTKRIVLGDWHHQCSYLEYDDQGKFTLNCQ